jgi:hypothetical protein
MKRITQGSSASLNETIFESLKPLYGTKGNPPYYDPNDLHVHIWKKGKLGLEDNPKIPTYAKGKLAVKDCVYCKVCHIIKDAFQSTVSSNRDIVDDIIMPSVHNPLSDYKIIEPNEPICPIEIKKVHKKIYAVPKNINQQLFHKQEGIFDEYVEVEDN